jgi:hypothetical protein
MADEVTVNGSLEYEDAEDSELSLGLANATFDVSTKKFIHHKMAVGTSEEAIPLGEVTSLGWAIFKNLDDENYLEIRSATGAGNDIIKLPPLSSAGPFHFGSDVSAPFAIANTAACQMEYLIVSQ